MSITDDASHYTVSHLFLHYSTFCINIHFGTHAQKGYSTCLVCVCVSVFVCVCVSVRYHSSTNIAHLYALNKVRRGLF